ncbi:MAG: hypothetical protein K8U57_01475 [Planctomycetes bacterium]|nr:hypothetical protein [Planctomycetota bacterium]
MPTFQDWLKRLLTHGESVQDTPPSPITGSAAEESLLRAAFITHSLDIAGPALTFDAAAACGAAKVLAQACWFLVGGTDERVTLSLTSEQSPAAHLSADVTLRFLRAVYRRARFREPDGELTRQLDALLRAWPLSGVLADLDGSPTTTPEFGNHPGLQLLYAERLAGTGRAGWVPVSGSAREYAERVHQELGKPLPALPTEEAHA